MPKTKTTPKTKSVKKPKTPETTSKINHNDVIDRETLLSIQDLTPEKLFLNTKQKFDILSKLITNSFSTSSETASPSQTEISKHLIEYQKMLSQLSSIRNLQIKSAEREMDDINSAGKARTQFDKVNQLFADSISMIEHSEDTWSSNAATAISTVLAPNQSISAMSADIDPNSLIEMSLNTGRSTSFPFIRFPTLESLGYHTDSSVQDIPGLGLQLFSSSNRGSTLPPFPLDSSIIQSKYLFTE